MGKGVSTPFRQEFLSSRQTELAARVHVSATWMRHPFTVKSHNVRTSLRFLRFSEKFVTATIVVSSHSSGVVLTGGFVAAIQKTFMSIAGNFCGCNATWSLAVLIPQGKRRL